MQNLTDVKDDDFIDDYRRGYHVTAIIAIPILILIAYSPRQHRHRH